MRNLVITSYDDTVIQDALPITATAWDTSNDSVICAFGPTSTQPKIELKRRRALKESTGVGNQYVGHDFALINSWDAPCPLPNLECDEILLMHHFADTSTTCIVLAGGDLILVREEPQHEQETIEIVGSIDDGIAAAAWAPDEEILAIVTRKDNLILMSKHLEPIHEVAISANDLLISKHVSVGWGKKETQFQGKRAKAMRDPTMPEYVDEGELGRLDNGSVSMSWRGDSAFLAVNGLVSGHRRAIRVYSREGALDSISEPVDGLESALSWRPYGNIIASIKRSGAQSISEKLEVVFFERNGLRHGGFELRLSPTEVEQYGKEVSLYWNHDSDVLAVKFHGIVQLWTMGNYHWYLKHQRSIDLTNQDKMMTVNWHSEKPLKCILASYHSLICLEYSYRACTGSTIMPYDFGATAVVDGTVLKLTPFKHAGVPPPMAFCELDAKSPVIDCAFSHDCRNLAVLTQDSLHLYEWDMRPAKAFAKEKTESRHTVDVKRVDSLSLASQSTPTISNVTGSQVCFVRTGERNEIYILFPPQRSSPAACWQVGIELAARDSGLPSTLNLITRQHPIPSFTQNIVCDLHQQAVWAQDTSSTVMIAPINQQVGGYALSNRFENGQPNSSIFQIPTHGYSPTCKDAEATFGQIYLTPQGSLYVNTRLLIRGCTSFIVTDSHLVLTTTQHLLKFVHLSEPERMVVPGDAPETDERCRAIETGARIVTVIPSIYATVLQMPRGNLETIYPRVLVLSGIRKSLSALDYRTAFLACQNHQVDMNILYDHQPDLFLSNLDAVITQLKKPSRIDEFLSKLKEEDVTESLYKDTLSISDRSQVNGVESLSSTKPLITGRDKVNQICDAFIAALNNKSATHLQNIITAHVCKRPPDLIAALTLVSSLRRNSSDAADSAILHLCFLTDTNRLFDAALALYDLDLTLLVAQNAQRDPREYMPFLQSLQAQPSLRRQYTIDNHLRNYSKALVSLHSLHAHEELQSYMIKHKLYTIAMELYKYDSTHLPRVTILYAEYLESQSQNSAAATLYESLGDNETAYTLYALAHQWRESLTCASLVPLTNDKLVELARRLAATLAEENRDYRAAATIQIEYLNDTSTAARLLCKGSYFAEAARVLTLAGFTSRTLAAIDTTTTPSTKTSIATILDPALTEKFGEIVELVADCKSQLAAQTARIRDLREKQAQDPLAFYGGDATAATVGGNLADDIPDNISLAPSDTSTMGGQSLFTRYGNGSNASTKFGGTVASNVSRKTSKTKRREERKRARGKKGSVYELEYLIASVRRLIERLNGTQDEVSRLTAGLLRRGMREQAIRVDEVMSEIGTLCESAIGDIWPPQNTHFVDSGNSVDNTYQRPSGADGVYHDARQGIDPSLPQDIDPHTGEPYHSAANITAPEIKKWAGSPIVMR